MSNFPENINPKRKNKNRSEKKFWEKYERKFLPKDPSACLEKLSFDHEQIGIR